MTKIWLSERVRASSFDVRRPFLFLALSVAAACAADGRGARADFRGEGSSRLDASHRTLDAIDGGDAGVHTSPPDPATYGERLTGASHLVPFFSLLARLERGTLGRDVRILQFGDSHTAADMQTGPMRRSLQERYGDGGRGFVPIGTPWKHFRQEGLLTGMTGWSSERGFKKHKYVGDGMYGLGGIAMVATRRGASLYSDIKVPFSRADIGYLEQPGGGSMDVLVDGAKVGKISTRGPSPVSRIFKVTTDEKPHRLELVARGDGALRVFGATLDRAAHGIQLDDLGINGLRASDAMRTDPSHLIDQLRFRLPDLLVVALGTNESMDDAPISTHESSLMALIERLRRSAKDASCLVLGPPDRAVATADGHVTAPRIVEIVAMERRVAERMRCAFYDELAAMGGEGSMVRWVEAETPPLAQRDYVHLSFPGYARVGVGLANDLVAAAREIAPLEMDLTQGDAGALPVEPSSFLDGGVRDAAGEPPRADPSLVASPEPPTAPRN